VREIETETFEENPPLFREYMTATPEMRVLMDNQFKNVKTHARLLSKALWYEWRSKLCDGLKEGLVKTAEGMDEDEKLLARQEALIAEVLPALLARKEALEKEKEELEEAEQELAEIDPQDLEDARAELAAVDKALAEKTRRLEELKKELGEATEGLDDLAQKKQLCLDEIREADRIREECRGWSTDEIVKHKGKFLLFQLLIDRLEMLT
jgi:kinetochore protein Spc7/SPC105